jgi:O-antigen/teichoic acid export membrane protein
VNFVEDPEQPSAEGSLHLPREEVRRRSLAGVFYISASNVANLLIGFFASLALARLLTPHDFGIVAVGSTALLIGGALADGGLGAGMIRRSTAPTRQELRTLNGIQLALSLAACGPAAAAALFFGRTGAVTAIMLASLPIQLLQTPGRIVLYRDMRYERQLGIDFGSQTAYQIFCVTSVALGAGVWGLATGAVLKAVVGTALTGVLGVRVGLPSLKGWRSYGSLIRFGLSFQASWFTWMAREQLLNVTVAVIAGVSPLGIWMFANRLFLFPSIAFNSLYAVAFPAMANLLARGEDAAPVILRTVRRSALLGTFVFTVFGAIAPKLIPVVFGETWSSAADILPFVCFSTLILGSIAVAATSYLPAAGHPGIVAWASASLGVVWIGTTAPLLPVVGVTAIGIGNLLGAFVEAFVLDRATKRYSGVAPSRAVFRPALVAFVAGGAGWLICKTVPGGIWVAALGGAFTIAGCVAGLLVLCRDDLLDACRLVLAAPPVQRLMLRGRAAPTPTPS